MDMNRSESFFNFSINEERISLEEVTTKISCGNQSYEGKGRAIFFINEPNIEIHSTFSGISVIDKLMLSFGQKNTKFEINNQEIEGWIKNIDSSQKSSVSISWQPKKCYIEPTKINKSQEIYYLYFHLVDLIADREFSLEWGKWKLNFNQNMQDSQKKIKSQRNLFIGCLTASGKNFTFEEANNFLSALSYFFSFSMGRWCNPFSMVGFDKKDTEIWKTWSTPKAAYKHVDSWVDSAHFEEQYKILFPLFMEAWSNKKFQDTLKTTIYWYITSNTIPEIEAKVILMQAALERLSFDYIVNLKKIITDKGFESLKPVSEKIRLLFTITGTDISLPSELSLLKSQEKVKDAPQTITDIRNSLIHAKQKTKISSPEVTQCSDLAIWYYEIALLKILGYKGKYQNRLQSHVNYMDIP